MLVVNINILISACRSQFAVLAVRRSCSLQAFWFVRFEASCCSQCPVPERLGSSVPVHFVGHPDLSFLFKLLSILTSLKASDSAQPIDFILFFDKLVRGPKASELSQRIDFFAVLNILTDLEASELPKLADVCIMSNIMTGLEASKLSQLARS